MLNLFQIGAITGSDCGGLLPLVRVVRKGVFPLVQIVIPIGLIIYGTIDLGKAVIAGKEDEMKKAQQRFIRRLIAAALLFIVPLILEFVLDKMGFGYDSCSLF